jgi:hypothetical protein
MSYTIIKGIRYDIYILICTHNAWIGKADLLTSLITSPTCPGDVRLFREAPMGHTILQQID